MRARQAKLLLVSTAAACKNSVSNSKIIVTRIRVIAMMMVIIVSRNS